jgi:hypothetical protein
MNKKDITFKKLDSGEITYSLTDFADDLQKEIDTEWGDEGGYERMAKEVNKKKKVEKVSPEHIRSVLFNMHYIAIVETACGLTLQQIHEKTSLPIELVQMGLEGWEENVEVVTAILQSMFLKTVRENYGLSDNLTLELLNEEIREHMERRLEKKV